MHPLEAIERLLDQANLSQAAGMVATLQADASARLPGVEAAAAARLAAERRELADAVAGAARALTEASLSDDPETLARVALSTAVVLQAAGDGEAAFDHLAVAEAAIGQAGDAVLTAATMRVRSALLSFSGSIDAGAAQATEATAAAHATGEAWEVARALSNEVGRRFSQAFAMKSDGVPGAESALEAAARTGVAAEAACNALGAHRLNLSNLNNLAGVLMAAGRDDEALACFARHRALVERTGLRYTLPNALVNEGRLERRRGNATRAEALAREGLALSEQLATVRPSALLQRLLSELAEDRRDFETALAHYKAYHALDARALNDATALRAAVTASRLDVAALRQRAEALAQEVSALASQTQHDPLTGLLNRRGLQVRLDAAWAEVAQGGPSAWVAMVDADHFKSVNDRHGHAVGDTVLQRIAACLKASTRSSDACGRWGGEEFLVLLVGVSPERAAAAAERMRAAVQAGAWNGLAEGLLVTVSIGLAPLTSEPVATALTLADEALYEAKRQGRNRIVMARVG